MFALILAAGACLPVDGDRVRMADLAAAIPEFRQFDPQEPVGFAPAPGAQRRFSALHLERLAARKNIAIQAEPLCFEREMETPAAERIIEALRAALPEEAQ